MKRAPSGFTLAEVLIASAIAAVALVAVSSAMSSATTSRQEYAERPVVAAQLAREIHALAETLPRTPAGSTGATEGADVTALDALIGARFSPPILADRSVNDALAEWTQAVDLELYALDDLEQPTGEDPAAALAPDAHRVYRLSVTMLRNDAPIETFHWWLKP